MGEDECQGPGPAALQAGGPHGAAQGGAGHHREYRYHRRRINTEAKAKVVASVWGEEFIQFCLG